MFANSGRFAAFGSVHRVARRLGVCFLFGCSRSRYSLKALERLGVAIPRTGCSRAPRWLLIVLFALCAAGARAEDAGEAVRTSSSFGKTGSSSRYEMICRTVERSAADNNLPIEFFTRVIWQESRFDVTARSSAGAQGIAQFMPRTASSRGLLNPFDPSQSLPQSASYLRELKSRFGNLGLAAAAYNAGPGQVRAVAFRKDPFTR